MTERYINFVCLLTVASLLYCIGYSKQLQIAAVLPLEHGKSQPSLSWERGLEILPGAQVAIEHINQHEDILPGYKLELRVIDSATCKNELNKDLLLNFINFTFYHDVNIIGLMGSYCPNSDQLISSLLASASLMNQNQPFLSSSVSVSNNDKILTSPYHYRILQSADVFIDTLSSLANDLEWYRIAVVTESTHTYFFSFAEAFYNVSTKRKSYKNTPFIQLHKDLPLKLVFQDLQKFDSKTTVLSLSIPNTIEILCSAKNRGLTWPGYAWIVHNITFVDFSLATKFVDMDTCNIHEALEGVILLEHRLSNSMISFRNLSTGYTYEDYIRNYIEKLENLSAKVNAPLRPNTYANLLHDSVWILALAFQSQTNVSNSLFPDYIRNISFVGTTGKIEFNDTFEIKTGVDIFQIRNGTPIHEGFYDPTRKRIRFMGSLLDNSRPIDRRTIITDNTSLIYTSIFSFAFFVCAVGVTFILSLYIYYHNEPEIKATSVTLSLLMFLGCYIILFYMLMAILYTQSLVPSDSSFNICLALLWSGQTGFSLPLILATLLVKMLRIYRIFNHFGKVGKVYSDIALLLYVLLLISPNIIILTIWTAIDPYSTDTVVTEYPRYTEVEQRCYSKQLLLWFCILYLNIEGLSLVLIIIAVKTRKIHRENFKDTKKVNAFIFILLIVIYVINVQWLILRSIGVRKGYSSIPLHISHVVVVVSCQALLFIPKILPPLKRSLKFSSID